MSADLGRYARQVIAERGVKVADYMAFVNGSREWYGDRCGCPDDRCAGGYHHDGGDDCCRCLPAVLDPSELEQLAAEANDALANPFTSRWGREHNEYLLHDVKQRLSVLNGG